MKPQAGDVGRFMRPGHGRRGLRVRVVRALPGGKLLVQKAMGTQGRFCIQTYLMRKDDAEHIEWRR